MVLLGANVFTVETRRLIMPMASLERKVLLVR
jgi:hypothetical protein